MKYLGKGLWYNQWMIHLGICQDTNKINNMKNHAYRNVIYVVEIYASILPIVVLFYVAVNVQHVSTSYLLQKVNNISLISWSC